MLYWIENIDTFQEDLIRDTYTTYTSGIDKKQFNKVMERILQFNHFERDMKSVREQWVEGYYDPFKPGEIVEIEDTAADDKKKQAIYISSVACSEELEE